MKYILKYNLFEAIDPKETYRRREEVSSLLKNSKGMKNIHSLFPEARDYYYIDKQGNIIFENSKNNKTIVQDIPLSKTKIFYLSHGYWGLKKGKIDKRFPSLEEALRYLWVYMIVLNARNFLNKEELFNKLYNDKKYWGETMTFWQILKKEFPNLIEVRVMDKETESINSLIGQLGLNMRFEYGTNDRNGYECHLDCLARRDMRLDTTNLKFCDIVEDIIKYYNEDYDGFKVHYQYGEFKVKTNDVKKEFLEFFKKFRWLQLCAKYGKLEMTLVEQKYKSIFKFLKKAYTAYIDAVFNGREFDMSLLFDISSELFGDNKFIKNNPKLIHYFIKNLPDAWDKIKQKMDNSGVKSIEDMNDMGFGD